MRRLIRLCLALVALWIPSFASAGDSADLEVVHRIKKEAFEKSQVMRHLFAMTDVAGPKLTASPGFQRAAESVAATLEEWGLENVALEPWEPFGRGWESQYVSAHLTSPSYQPLIAMHLAWTPGTDGVAHGVPILAPFTPGDTLDDEKRAIERFMEEHRGKLDGKIVLLRRPPHLELRDKARSERWDGAGLADYVKARPPVEPYDFDLHGNDPPEDDDALERRFWAHAPPWIRAENRERWTALRLELQGFLAEEGVAVALYPGRWGDAGTIFPTWAGQGSHKLGQPSAPPTLALTPEHYNRIWRLVERGHAPEVEIELRAEFYERTPVNIVAELPGRADSGKADELVLIGAHFDDVSYAVGATDNASGSAVMIEVMRILKTLDLKLDRTVRLILWSGEEQRLLGSEAYVKKHFANPETMELQLAHGKVSAYFNLDNGAGKIRGIHLQGNDMARPIFSAWLGPFSDLDASTITLRDTGGTDHLSFDAVGIPGFQFIQDELEYDTLTHHSNMDVYDRVPAADLMQASAIVAGIVYHAANRDELLPRKPLPEPWPEEERSTSDD